VRAHAAGPPPSRAWPPGPPPLQFCPSTDAFSSFADDLGTDLNGLLKLVPSNQYLFKTVRGARVWGMGMDGATAAAPSRDPHPPRPRVRLLAPQPSPRRATPWVQIIQGHSVSGLLPKAQLKKGMSLNTLAGGKLNVVSAGSALGLKWSQVRASGEQVLAVGVSFVTSRTD
jgi:hypothetical protein